MGAMSLSRLAYISQGSLFQSGEGTERLFCSILGTEVCGRTKSDTTEATQQQQQQVALAVKNPPAKAGDTRDADSIPGLGRSPGGGHGKLLQYS